MKFWTLIAILAFLPISLKAQTYPSSTQVGLAAALPAFCATPGQFYYATDTGVLYVSTVAGNSCTWSTSAPSAGSAITINGSPLATPGTANFLNGTNSAAQISFVNPGTNVVNGLINNIVGNGSAVLSCTLTNVLANDVFSWDPGNFCANHSLGIPVVQVTAPSFTLTTANRGNQIQLLSGAAAVSIPQAGSAGFGSSYYVQFWNSAAGTVTLNPTVSTINGNASAIVTNGQVCDLRTIPGNNYTLDCAGSVGAIYTGTANQVTVTGTVISTPSPFVAPGSISAPSGTVSAGSSPPTCTPGTAGAFCSNEGTAPSGVNGVDDIYGNATNHCVDVVNGTVDKGCVLANLAANVTNAGVFLSSAQSEYLTSIINSCSITTVIGGGFTSTDGIAACVSTPSSGRTNGLTNGIAAYVLNNDSSNAGAFAGSVANAFYGRSICTVGSHAECEGAVFSAGDTPGQSGTLLVGTEVDAGAMNTSTTGFGFYTSFYGPDQPTGDNFPAYYIGIPSGTSDSFTSGFKCAPASVVSTYSCLSVGPSGPAGGPSTSQNIRWNYINSGSTPEFSQIYVDDTGLFLVNNPMNMPGLQLTGSSSGTAIIQTPAAAGTPTLTLPTASGILVASPATLVLATAPVVASGFGTSAAVVTTNGTAAFTINVGTSNTGTGILTLPTATHNWACSATDITTTSATVFITKVVPTSSTSVTFQNYSDAAATHDWVDSDVLEVQCSAY